MKTPKTRRASIVIYLTLLAHIVASVSLVLKYPNQPFLAFLSSYLPAIVALFLLWQAIKFSGFLVTVVEDDIMDIAVRHTKLHQRTGDILGEVSDVLVTLNERIAALEAGKPETANIRKLISDSRQAIETLESSSSEIKEQIVTDREKATSTVDAAIKRIEDRFTTERTAFLTIFFGLVTLVVILFFKKQ